MTAPTRAPIHLLALLAATTAAAPALADHVTRRGTEPPIVGDMLGLDDSGVRIRSRLGAVHFVPWDRVRELETDQPVMGLDRHLELAVDLWRARSRVERHDTPLAEPLFERLFEQYRGRTHETALVVAEGLLRCRLARGDHILAMVPALESARMRRAGVTTDSYSSLPPVIDGDTALCPALAPAWLPTRLRDTLERDLAGYDAQGDTVIAAIASLYRRALRQAIGSPALPATEHGTGQDHPGVELMEMLIDCTGPDARDREAARERLRRSIARRPAWCEAGARFQIGVSLAGEQGLGRRQRGMVSLAHLPARFGRTQPFLAGLALAHIAAGLGQTGDRAGADSIRAQLARAYPDHPLNAIGVERIVPLRFAPAPPPATAPEENE